MKIKTSDLEGASLDWAVAKSGQPVYSARALIAAINGGHDGIGNFHEPYTPSSNWEMGGPIIESEGINTFRYNKLDPSERDKWCGHKAVPRPNMEGSTNMVALTLDGPTPLIAAMRCYVASKLGDVVDVPEELVLPT